MNMDIVIPYVLGCILCMAVGAAIGAAWQHQAHVKDEREQRDRDALLRMQHRNDSDQWRTHE